MAGDGTEGDSRWDDLLGEVGPDKKGKGVGMAQRLGLPKLCGQRLNGENSLCHWQDVEIYDENGSELWWGDINIVDLYKMWISLGGGDVVYILSSGASSMGQVGSGLDYVRGSAQLVVTRDDIFQVERGSQDESRELGLGKRTAAEAFFPEYYAGAGDNNPGKELMQFMGKLARDRGSDYLAGKSDEFVKLFLVDVEVVTPEDLWQRIGIEGDGSV